jgi:hypothetical protein
VTGYQTFGASVGSGNTCYYTIYNQGTNEWEDLGEAYYQSNVTNTSITMPKPEKWKGFGKFITKANQTHFTDSDGKVKKLTAEERQRNWNEAKNEAYSNLLPEAYDWYKKNFIDVTHEDAPKDWFFKKLKIANDKDELSPDAIQDLIDFSAFRDDLFGNKSIYGTVIREGKESE